MGKALKLAIVGTPQFESCYHVSFHHPQDSCWLCAESSCQCGVYAICDSATLHVECQQADARTATGEGEAACVATLS